MKSAFTSSLVLTKEFLIQVMEGFKNEVFTEINSFKAEFSELTASVEFVSDNIDSSNKLMENIQTQFAQLKKEMNFWRLIMMHWAKK